MVEGDAGFFPEVEGEGSRDGVNFVEVEGIGVGLEEEVEAGDAGCAEGLEDGFGRGLDGVG